MLISNKKTIKIRDANTNLFSKKITVWFWYDFFFFHIFLTIEITDAFFL